MATSSTLLESARPFLCKDLNSIDKNLPKLLTILHSTGTDECWHRSGTFYDHLYQVYRILKLWKAPDPVCTFGLFHSAYSNSYSDDLAIFGSLTNRETVRQHVGPVAESLIHLFCIVPRYTLIDEDLVFRYTDAELREHLQASSEYSLKRHHGHLELVVPPVFDRCTKVLDPGEQMMARDLYWEAVYHDQPSNKEMGEELLIKCIEMNPFVGEPHVLLSQFYMSRGRFEEGKREGEKGLGLLLEWGCAWDKRVSWEGWVSWCRVLVSKAKERSWPHTSWGIISLGHVK
ncbi:hypothetical protein SSX86_027916 [Deinandra increscens subsp. villosa]|uniref:DUF6817 domain-containing protein n=1 Tax=Deinandra increscens subsp. villosa TaxID=3103831 RepID=A0AAP0C6Q2_9ASTR